MTIKQLQECRNKLLKAHSLIHKFEKLPEVVGWLQSSDIANVQNDLQDVLVYLSNEQFEKETEVRNYIQTLKDSWEEGIQS
jgi:hypothetical protein